MCSRPARYLALVATAVLVFAAARNPAAGAPASVLRIGEEAGGTLAWELWVILRSGLDRRYGFTLQPVRFATKEAAETALWGGEVDLKVDDWLFASRARRQGFHVQATDAFSRAIGGIMVPAAGPIRSIGDLRGRRIGVSSAADKSYLALRAVATAQFRFDPQTSSSILQAAPPLLNELLERGQVDAIVQYWQFIPALVSTNRFRELASAVDLLRRIVPGGDLPFLVVVARDDAVRAKAGSLRSFLAALRAAKRELASQPDLWDELFGQGRLGISDHQLIDGLAARYRLGLPGPWTKATVDGLAALTAKLIDVAGPEVMGVASLDPLAFNTDLVRPQ